MDITKPLWIGSTVDVRQGDSAAQALNDVSDAKYWDDLTGIVAVDHERWLKAQEYERDCWMQHALSAQSDRNHEHYQGFGEYASLPDELDNVVEIGCGPFTQLATILDTGRTVSDITLVDPLIESYISHPYCSYQHGTLRGIPITQLLSIQGEQFADIEKYNTAVCINVLEHVQDADMVLNNLYNCLRTGGIIVFHERSWDHIDVSIVYDAGHPIRLKKSVIDAFTTRFTPMYVHQEYFIGIK